MMSSSNNLYGCPWGFPSSQVAHKEDLLPDITEDVGLNPSPVFSDLHTAARSAINMSTCPNPQYWHQEQY